MPDVPADMLAALADWGIPITGGVPGAKGIKIPREPEVLASVSPGVRGRLKQVLVRAVDFPAVNIGTALTIEGQTYTVRDKEAVHMGHFYRLDLKVP